MDQASKEKIKLTTKELIISFFDNFAKFETIFGYPWQRKEAYEYLRQREKDKNDYYRKLWYLEKRGYIERFKEEKKTTIKLTPLGEKKALKYLSGELKIKKPKKWDKKWRIVIFDVPQNKNALRNIVREKIKQLGFYQLQKSVFVYPFDSYSIINYLKYVYDAGPFLQYIVAETIESETNLVSWFYDRGLLRGD